jgi:hypothetical protein
MPVITRSQAKRIASTGSIDEPSTSSSCTTGSTDGLSLPTLNNNSYSDEYLHPVIPDAVTTSSTPHVISSVNSSSSSIVDPALEFQISNTTESHLKISNCHFFESSGVSSRMSSVGFSHNFSVSNFCTMEDDCDDSPGFPQTTQNMFDINHLFDTFTKQLSVHMNNLQAQLRETDERVFRNQVAFKQEIREEMDELRSLLIPPSSPPLIPDASAGSPKVSTLPSSVSIDAPSAPFANTSSSEDVQTKMMLMLTESFSKLSNVLADNKTQDTKNDWPKFSGDAKKFRSWYLSIMALISIPPWSEFYDASKNDVVLVTTNSALNGKLYAKLISVLDGQALQDMIARSHLRANGLLLLQELVHTYKPTNVPEVLAAKAGEFWSKMKRSSSESVDTYYNRFRELLDDLDQADDKISTKSAMRHFIFTLGPEFEAIQNNYRIGNLPPEWNTTHWPTLLVLCRNYYNSVNPKGVGSVTKDSSTDSHTKRMAQLKKVKEWFLNPAKFSKEILLEQQKYPGQCIFHLTKTHLTEDCNLKRECDKIIQAKRRSNANQGGSASNSSSQGGQTSGASGHLRLVTEEVFADANMHEDLAEVVADECDGNDTNEADLYYFARLSNHYLRLVKNTCSVQSQPRHPTRFPVIADSGANYHMFRDRAFFVSLQPSSGKVYLGDGKTSLAIHGVGTVKCQIGSNTLTLHNVRYIPDLSESIYSLFQHVQCPGHKLESSYEQGLYIIFPTFRTKAIIGRHDIYLDATPVSIDNNADSASSSSPLKYVSVCRDITEFQKDVQIETDKLNNILRDLRKYYADVKTKRQLGLNVPAGFRRQSNLQTNTILHTPPRKSTLSSSDMHIFSSLSPSNLTLPTNMDVTTPCDPDNESSLPSHDCVSSLQEFVPIIRSVDKPSSSLPQTMAMTEDTLRASVGFRRIDAIKKHLKTLYQPTVVLDHTPPDAVLDPGFYASLKKKDRNTTPVARTKRFGDVIHLDIVFGPEISIGNIHYGLLCVDRFSRMSYLYPLQNLTSDIPKQIEAFFAHIGMRPRRIVTDFDLKLVGGKARDYFNSLLVHVNAAPSHRQDKNGLAERHWQTLVTMARTWLASAELPSSFWFYAVRRATEVCNYFPLQLEDGSFITPFELVHAVKPDLRVLFKPFTLAAVRRERVGNETLGKFEAQSTPMITLGRCPTSNGLLFYNPVNNSFVSSIDYTFQPNVTSGARFGYKYSPGTFIYRLDEPNTIYAPQFPLDSEVDVHTHSPPHRGTITGVPTYNHPDIYVVRFRDGTLAEYTASSGLLTAVDQPCSAPSRSPTLPDWVIDGCPATLFLNDMAKPRHGRLRLHSSDKEWYFCPGNTSDFSKGTVIHDLTANCQQLMESSQLFRGHAKFPRVYQARHQTLLQSCVLRHVSAHGLQSLIPPASLKHHSTLSPSDKLIWDNAYCEEYDGLSSIPTWEVLSESQFKQLSKGRKSLPSMAISTIKYDTFNKPKRAKYRIVVLGNLDYHQWSKESTAAPVMSQLELRLLTSLAVFHKHSLKNCDIKQAFVQSSLPPDEEYFVRPPIGCPKSAPGTYWRLLRSLYGLKRAPKLWYEKLSSHLKNMGLRSCENSPCLFFGTIIDGEAPIYVGIYVDDIIYFSPSEAVEKQFENLLSTIGEVDYMGQVSHFLGIEFTWHHHVDGNVSVNLTQQSFTESLLDSLGFPTDQTSTFTTPYRSGMSIDSIPSSNMSASDRDHLRLQYQSLVGSLNWLSITTRPDISTVVSLLAQHQSYPSQGHLDAAYYVARYLSQTKTLGIYFNSSRRVTLESFLHFPISPNLLAMSDANWGPQDASMSKLPAELPLFASRSMSAFYVDLLGPIHWMSKRQTVTAGSSAEAEIYATNECVKFLLELSQLLEFLEVRDVFMPKTTVIFNDNSACVDWSKKSTTKGLRHIQMRENLVRENVAAKFVSVQHIGGKVNLADLFTKEMKDTAHFVELRDLMMRPRAVT